MKLVAGDERKRPLPNPDYPWRGSFPDWNERCVSDSVQLDNSTRNLNNMVTAYLLAEADLQTEHNALRKMQKDYEKALTRATIKTIGKNRDLANRALMIVHSKYTDLINKQRIRIKKAQENVADSKKHVSPAREEARAKSRDFRACRDEQEN